MKETGGHESRRRSRWGGVLVCVLTAGRALAGPWTAPFLCDADLDLYLNDDRARVVCGGEPVTFYARGIRGVRVDGADASAVNAGAHLMQAQLPAGTHEVEIVRDPSARVLGSPGGPAVSGPARPARIAAPNEYETLEPQLQPGAEVVIRNGAYRDWQMTVKAGGLPGRPVVIRPQTPGGVLLMGRTSLRIKADHVVLRELRFCGSAERAVEINGSHNRITQCQFEQCGNVMSSFGHVVSIGWNSDSNRVDHCYFVNSRSMSLGQAAGGYPKPDSGRRVGVDNRFDHNIFRDIYRLWRNGQEAIQIGQGQAPRLQPRALIAYNVFDNASGDSEIISLKSSNNAVRHNLFVNCDGSMTLRNGNENLLAGNVLAGNINGFTVRGERHRIVNNLIVNMAGSGVRLSTGKTGDERLGAVKDCLIAHNTFVGCRVGIGTDAPSDREDAAYPENNLVLNNVLTGGKGTLLRIGAASHARVGPNLVWATGEAVAGYEGAELVLKDPLLTGEGTVIAPGPGSPAIDAAAPVAGVDADLWGTPRPQGQAADMGAVEAAPAARRGSVWLPDFPRPRNLAVTNWMHQPLVAYDSGTPLAAWTAGGDATGRDGVVRIGEGTLALRSPLPPDFVFEWEYRPETFDSRAEITFCAGVAGDGYRLAFGGSLQDKQEGKIPTGIIKLGKGPGLVLEAPHAVDYRMNYRHAWSGNTRKIPFDHPIPELWTTFRLLKLGRFIRMEMTNVSIMPDGQARGGTSTVKSAKQKFGITPVLIWEDTGEIDGPPRAGPFLKLEQSGTGYWRNLRLWRAEGAEDGG
ncbi:MAG: polysaccharide lyase 6 family protein [Kiritimatiellae bacterium]|nr:polysaccharide lyase 6 family protein [Kiritimatiellia bacterium]